MALDDYDGECVATGGWFYGGDVAKVVKVVAYDCDFHFHRIPSADGRPRPEPYPLNPEGRLYYLQQDGDVISNHFQTAAEARAWADAQPWAPIAWHET